MADITDPTITAFVSEVMRPLSDRMAGIVATMAVERSKYTDVIKPLMSGDLTTDEVFDGAHTDGRTVLTKGDLNKFWAVMDPILEVIEGLDVTLAANAKATDDLLLPHVNVIMP